MRPTNSERKIAEKSNKARSFLDKGRIMPKKTTVVEVAVIYELQRKLRKDENANKPRDQ